ncbi:potassium-transporting ATPase subunit KdpC [Acinetobacter rudis]|uniref:potassium-transporting ATPase subunit KdpC n=1 Tax=Acinetobacter rudis TaxID=632955 RepID=UPI00333E5CCE
MSNFTDLNREPHVLQLLRPALGLSAVALVLCGFAYSAVATGLGQVLFPFQANGSLLHQQQQPVGSSLVAQAFVSDQYFYARPSQSNYSVIAMSGSNLARSNPELQQLIDERRTQIATREHITADKIPSDLLTASGSGIDPEISPEAARLQVARIAKARHMSVAQVEQVLNAHIMQPTLGLLGQPRVNVLKLNLALDDLKLS